MIELIQEPWMEMGMDAFWMVVVGFLVCLSCGLAGVFLCLKRQSMMGDAISHSVLPGLVLAFLWVKRMDSFWLLIGAGLSGLFATGLIGYIEKRSRLPHDAVIGIVFSLFFAMGIWLISAYSRGADLDLNCVLMGRLEYLSGQDTWRLLTLQIPQTILVLGGLVLIELLALMIWYPRLLVTYFDPTLGKSLGYPIRWIQQGLLALVSVVMVLCFESVGAILVVALLVLPCATGLLMSRRLPVLFGWVIFLSLWSALGGWYLAYFADCSLGAAIVLAAAFALGFAWMITLARKRKKRMPNRDSEGKNHGFQTPL